MGTFTSSFDDQRRTNTVTVPVLVDEENLLDAQRVIEAGPDSLTGELTNIAASSGVAEITVTYTGPNASPESIKKILRDGGLLFSTKRPKTEKGTGDD